MNKVQMLRRKVLVLAVAEAVAQLALAPAANAALINVDGVDCTLREAIISAQRSNSLPINNGCVEGDVDAIDTIALQNSSAYTIPADPLPLLNTPLVIEGNGSTIDAMPGPIMPTRLRIFDISGSSATITINDLTITGGQLADGSLRGAGLEIDFNAQVILNNCTVSGNSALRDGGGISVIRSTLTLNNTTVTGNSAGDDGGGIFSEYSVINISNSSALSSNSAGERSGAIYARRGMLDIRQSSLTNNRAVEEGGAIRLFGGELIITDSQITGNSVTDTGSAGAKGGGLSLRSNATVTLSNTAVSRNTATSFGGGIHLVGGQLNTDSSTIIDANSGSFGGGIFASSSPIASITDESSITNNIATNGSGGGLYFIGGSLTIANSTVSSNSASGGGALGSFSAVVEINDSILRENSAQNRAGGIYVSNGSLTINKSEITGQEDVQTGSGIRVNRADLTMFDSTVSGHSVGGNNNGGAIYFSSGNLTIERSHLLNNSSTYYGGGIHIRNALERADLTDVEIRGNSASRGGGGVSIQSNHVSIQRTEIAENSAERRGGGVTVRYSSGVSINESFVTDNTAELEGGGLYLRQSDADVGSSTISSNTATNHGGGIEQSFDATLTMLNSTISGNSTKLANGGALRSTNSQNISELVHTTFSDNTAAGNGGAINLIYSASASFIGSIVAGNIAESGVGNEIANYANLSGDHNNLFGTSSLNNDNAFVGFVPGPTDINATQDGARPKSLAELLEPLADNGGPTLTHALVASSVAISKGDSGFCLDNGILTDQRGAERLDGRCDIGAFEGVEDSAQCFVVALDNGKAMTFCL